MFGPNRTRRQLGTMNGCFSNMPGDYRFISYFVSENALVSNLGGRYRLLHNLRCSHRLIRQLGRDNAPICDVTAFNFPGADLLLPYTPCCKMFTIQGFRRDVAGFDGMFFNMAAMNRVLLKLCSSYTPGREQSTCTDS
ncbi:hypothetical protein D3C71_909180 [compost metagenome]